MDGIFLLKNENKHPIDRITFKSLKRKYTNRLAYYLQDRHYHRKQRNLIG